MSKLLRYSYLTALFVLLSAQAPSLESTRALDQMAVEARNCRDAHAAMEKWQKIYHLSDWNIKLVCGVPSFIEQKSGVFIHGITEWHVEREDATVWVNPKSDFPPERIVIHELLHIVLGEVKVSQSALKDEQATWLLGNVIWDRESRQRKSK